MELPGCWLSSRIEYERKTLRRQGRGWYRGDPPAASTSPEVSASFYLQIYPLCLGHMPPLQQLKRTFASAPVETPISLVPEAPKAEEFTKSQEGPQIIIRRPFLPLPQPPITVEWEGPARKRPENPNILEVSK